MSLSKPLFLSLFFLSIILEGNAQLFVPYPEDYRRLVQSISFSPDDSIMYFTLPHREHLIAQGLPVDDKTPRLAIYRAKKENDGWGIPELLPFCWEFKDYEPSLSPDGNIMFFNSNRPEVGNEPLEKNSLWFSVRQDGLWLDPQYMPELNTEEFEESYATISRSGNLVYVAERLVNGSSEYAIYETQFEGTLTQPGRKIEVIDNPKGSGDPLIAADGSYLIFTKFDDNNWRETCDLHISFRKDSGWGSPIAIEDLNSDGADFAAAISADERWIYYRKNFQFLKLPFQPILEKYRSGGE